MMRKAVIVATMISLLISSFLIFPIDHVNGALDSGDFNDNSPNSGTTGDFYNFSINTSGADETIVNVSVNWTHESNNIYAGLNDQGGGNWSLTIKLDHSILNMTYAITISNATNSFSGSQQTVNVSDDDAPAFGTPSLNPDPPTTGEDLTISIDVTDTTGVSSVTLYHNFDVNGTFSQHSTPSKSGDTYAFTIRTPNGATSLDYYIEATDSVTPTANSAFFGTSSIPNEIDVNDNDGPTFSDPSLNPDPPTTGEDLTISIDVTDTTGVSSVTLYHNFDVNGTFSQHSTPSKSGDTYAFTIRTPNGATSLDYYIEATDSVTPTANSAFFGTSSIPNEIDVNDNDGPTFSDPSLNPDPPTTGEDLDISIDVTDTTGVSSVTLYHNFDVNGTFSQHSTPSKSGDTYAFTIRTPNGATSLDYYIEATDSVTPTANSAFYGTSSIPNEIDVNDNDGPTFSDPSLNPDPPTTGEDLTISIDVTDTTGVSSVTLYHNFDVNGTFSQHSTPSKSGDTYAFTIRTPNGATSLDYYIEATDSVTPTANSAFYGTSSIPNEIDVNDNDGPTFSDPSLNPDPPTTGEDLTISIDVTDTTGISSVTLYHQFDVNVTGYTQHNNPSISGNTYSFTIKTPDDATSLDYYFTAVDTVTPTANSANYGTDTSPNEIDVNDNDGPTFSNLVLSPDPPTTGEILTISIDVTDTTGISSVTLYHNFDVNGTYSTHSTPSISGDTYSFTIKTPDVATSLDYYFEATDNVTPTANSAIYGTSTNPYEIDVDDNDGPAFSNLALTPNPPTTGDDLHISIDVTDTTGILSVTLYHKFDVNGTYSIHITPSISWDTYSFTIKTPDDATSLDYYFEATDTVTPTANSATNGTSANPYEIDVDDNDAPTFGTQALNPDPPTTGDDLHISIDVTDTTGILSVTLYHKFDVNDTYSTHSTPSVSGDTYSFTIKTPDDANSLDYYFEATDNVTPTANTATYGTSTNPYEIDVDDNDGPTFITPSLHPDPPTTGDDLHISINVTDTTGISLVTLYHKFDVNDTYSQHSTFSNSGDTFIFTIKAPDGATSLDYYFEATDTVTPTANSATYGTSTNPYEIDVDDNDAPTFGTLSLNPDPPTTGDDLHISIDVMDTTGILSVTLYHKFDVIGTYSTHSTPSISGDTYTFIIRTPNDANSLDYYFEATDTVTPTSNSATYGTSTNPYEIDVNDNDNPIFNDNSSDTSTTGAQFIFDISAEDNIEMDKVTLDWTHGGMNGSSVELTDDRDGTWSLTIDLDQSTEDLTYTVILIDTSGNSYEGLLTTVKVRDAEDPFVKSQSDITIYSGMLIEIDINATDNIGIEEVKWEGLPSTFYGIKFEGYVNQSGTYPMIITVTDGTMNTAEIRFKVSVLPKNNDMDEDGIPDLIETQYGLDPLDPIDANIDKDGDGLSNLEEYWNGTYLDNNDTDEDKMWDGWEVEFGLNPLDPSDADDDLDNDGLTNLEEWTKNSDPTKKPKEGGFNYLWGLLTTPIFLIIIGGIVAYTIVRKRRKIIKLLGPADPGGVKEIFISYAHNDRDTAYSICNKLEEKEMRCWIAPRDVTPGVTWGKAIIKAINSARIMVRIFSADSNESEQVLREVERAVNKKIPIVLFRITDITPSEELEYYISAIHWLDAIDEPLEEHIDDLAKNLQQTLDTEIESLEPGKKKDLLPKESSKPSLPPKSNPAPIPEAEPVPPLEQSEPPKEDQI